MAYDEAVAEKLRRVLGKVPAVAEIKMMGGLCFTSRGNMLCGVVDRDLVVRVGAEGYAAALERPHARPMDFTGRPLKGFVYVGPRGHAAPADLRRWVALAARFVGSLPDKKKTDRRKAGRVA